MAGQRRSTRISSSQQSQESTPSVKQSSSPAGAGQKRKAAAGSSPAAKRGKNTAEKEQKTLEEVIDTDSAPKATDEDEQEPKTANQNGNGHKGEDVDMKDQGEKPATKQDTNGHDSSAAAAATDDKDQTEKSDQPEQKSKDEKPEAQTAQPQNAQNGSESKPEDKTQSSKDDNAVDADARPEKVPSSILEKGIIYIVYRGRVNIESPSNVGDIARTYMILRPLPHGAALSDGAIGDDKNCRLIAIPKKTLPISGREKWTAFVETTNTTFKDLKENFLKDDNYTTQTQGAQHTPSTKPAAEGVYAITTTGRETHLAYIITLPSALGEVQKDLGIRQRGSFVMSVKNPKAPGPANADLGQDPGYSDELQNEFRSLRWAPLKPDHLNYEACQFLMIGETEGSIESATEVQSADAEKDKAEPKEELEKLEDEDETRVEHLGEDDAIYTDLGVDAKNYPSLDTTW